MSGLQDDPRDASTAANESAEPVQVVILAAGMGTRLGRPHPKPLTELSDGRSIMSQQHDNIRAAFGDRARISIVVGFKQDLIMEAFPDSVFVYNEAYDQTNTSKSLLKALRASWPGPVIWMNGDVVFDPEVLRRLEPELSAGRSVVCVDTSTVAEEEVKYTVDKTGHIAELSKQVEDGAGEAVGINLIAAADKAALIAHLDACDDQDYFERGIELGIEGNDLQMVPLDITDLFAVEVDFAEDLARANRELGG